MATSTSPRWTAKYWAERIGRYGGLERKSLPVQQPSEPPEDKPSDPDKPASPSQE